MQTWYNGRGSINYGFLTIVIAWIVITPTLYVYFWLLVNSLRRGIVNMEVNSWGHFGAFWGIFEQLNETIMTVFQVEMANRYCREANRPVLATQSSTTSLATFHDLLYDGTCT